MLPLLPTRMCSAKLVKVPPGCALRLSSWLASMPGHAVAMANLGSIWEELLGGDSWGKALLQLRIDADFLLQFDTLLLRATAPEVSLHKPSA